MPTVIKSWTFASDNEGLADAGQTGNITFSWESGDGSPSNGCIKAVVAGGMFEGEKAYKASTTDTWETWGVPSGATVTNVNITGKYKSAGSHDPGVTVNIIDSTGGYIISGGSSGNSTTWTDFTPVNNAAVGASYQASTTSVRLMLLCSTGFPSANDTEYIDTIDATITYTEGGGGGGGTHIPAAIGGEQRARGHANLRR